MSRQSAENFQGTETTLYGTIMVDIYHYTLGMNPNAPVGFIWILGDDNLSVQVLLIVNKYTTLVSDDDDIMGETYVYWGPWAIQEIPVSS